MPSRAVLEGVLSLQACEELLLLARSLAVVGYREGVCSATIFEVAAALPSALIPLVAAREAVRAAVEEALGLELGLMVEFTGLICWRPGSRIGWHHDANRPYLRQRTHSAVCYLQRAGSDFGGGTFQFQLGSCGAEGPQDVLAAPGRVVAYDAQEEHGVTPVEWGERCALTLWFTDVLEHCEDSRLLAVLAGAPQHLLGLPSSMWLLEDGTDLQLCRLAMTGFALVHSGTLLHNAEAVPDGQEQQHLSSQGQASSELLPPGELAAAAAAEAHSQVAHQAALDGLLPRWLQLGALFAAD
ncbi:Oxoglutarate iron-dependent dioxygenase [Chlorella sorokiniana]|uniref:procollagen-proline 3-dioxygenase n=1 Tax=Chlorella sorokiniana TaxID=3076 RepID=A0A2P6TW81_CHLSO|nr:Oxoglutarate iron-dependent dioxygenase [Chlorella sorokiniana]|eukprot:PRW58320.1 Oxoglutarate iron-dependent dioxygenase [Chlorella sorokiniana]